MKYYYLSVGDWVCQSFEIKASTLASAKRKAFHKMGVKDELLVIKDENVSKAIVQNDKYLDFDVVNYEFVESHIMIVTGAWIMQGLNNERWIADAKWWTDEPYKIYNKRGKVIDG